MSKGIDITAKFKRNQQYFIEQEKKQEQDRIENEKTRELIEEDIREQHEKFIIQVQYRHKLMMEKDYKAYLTCCHIMGDMHSEEVPLEEIQSFMWMYVNRWYVEYEKSNLDTINC